jgi:hypothetical protein
MRVGRQISIAQLVLADWQRYQPEDLLITQQTELHSEHLARAMCGGMHHAPITIISTNPGTQHQLPGTKCRQDHLLRIFLEAKAECSFSIAGLR